MKKQKMSTSIQTSRQQRPRRPNHMSNRGGYPSANSHRRDTPENENSPSPSSNSRSIYDDPRSAAVLASVSGSRSTVTTRNGNKYKGHTTAFSPKGAIALSDAKLETEDSSHEQRIQGIVIPKDQFVVCVTNGVDVKGLSIGASDFTDAGITSRQNGSSQHQMKVLQPWHDEDADITTPMTLDDDQTGWDPTAMFQENKDKFNVKTSFQEDLKGYTTDLPDPKSEGYQEREMYAQRKADEIEKDKDYQSNIAKENEDSDEESKYSAVHRSEKESNVRAQESQPSSGVKPYVNPMLRREEQNGSQSRQAGHSAQRQNSPNFPQQSVHNSRQHMSNHYHQSFPSRNQRQQQSQSPNHSAPPPHPPPHHHPVQQSALSQAPLQQQQSSRTAHPSQVSAQSSKPNLPHHTHVPSYNQQQQQQNPAAMQKAVQVQQAPVMNSKTGPPNSQQSLHRAPVPPQHVNGDGQHVTEMVTAHTLVSGTNMSESPVGPIDQKSVVMNTTASASPQAASPPALPGVDRRVGKGPESSPDENRNKVKNKMQQLKEFSNNFVLDDSSKSQESTSEATEDSSKSSTGSSTSSGIGTADTFSASSPTNVVSNSPSSLSSGSTSVVSTDQKPAASPIDAGKQPTESEPPKSETPKSTLNPYAAEFKPKSQPVQVEAPVSTPPLRVSSHAMPPTYAPNMTWMQAPAFPYYTARKGVLPRDFSAQVTGQPLLAHGQPMIYMPGQTPSYQVYAPNPRMVAPNSFPGSQGGQAGLDQSSPQPQQVFMPAGQQQLVATPMPAHLTSHPQPAHGQPMHIPTSVQQQPQPAHIANPAPSPVQHQHQHQQQQQAHSGQPMPHPVPQGPPQSLTPQPAHYPHVNLQPGIQAMPRTSSGQHGGIPGPGHSSVSLNYPTLQQYTYPSASSGQNNFVPAPQPQMSQSSNHHNPGHQPQYVVMPQPQGPTPMQPLPGQPYSSPGIPFQQQHNILSGPPQMPPNPSHTPNQGASFIHSGVQGMPAGLHQQVQGPPSSVIMPMQYPPQQ